MVKQTGYKYIHQMPYQWHIADIRSHTPFNLLLIQRVFNIKKAKITQSRPTKGMNAICPRKTVYQCAAEKTGQQAQPDICVYRKQQQKQNKNLWIQITAYIQVVQNKNLQSAQQNKGNDMSKYANCQG